MNKSQNKEKLNQNKDEKEEKKAKVNPLKTEKDISNICEENKKDVQRFIRPSLKNLTPEMKEEFEFLKPFDIPLDFDELNDYAAMY